MIRKAKNTEEPSLKKFKFLIPLPFLIIFIGVFLWWHWATAALAENCLTFDEIKRAQNEQCKEKIFIVRKGESLSSVAKRLQQEGLIRDDLAFKLIVLSQGLTQKIQAGSFSLSASLTPREIGFNLTHGTNDVWLTFPEGWRKEEFAQRLKANLNNFDSEQFLQLALTHEGELFPDTYLISKQASPAAVFNLFYNNFQKKFDKELENSLAKLGWNKKEVLILASLVEREVKNDQDRPLVAGILVKRLKAGWPLQVDAALQYAIGSEKCKQKIKEDEKCDWWDPVKKEDLSIDSPYNTYKNKGLPPTPICNPGLASIKAVIDPQESDYWFYLSDGQGKIHFARTMEEHQKNIEEYLK